MKQIGKWLAALAFAAASIGISHANSVNTTVVASGLDGPRGLRFGPDGDLYVSDFGAAAPGTGEIVRISIPENTDDRLGDDVSH